MNTDKLKEALIELRQQRELLSAAIADIEGILKTLNGGSAGVPVASGKRSKEKESYIDLSVRILEEAGKPMHIADIAKRISGVRGKLIPRASVESSVIRHIQVFGAKARIIKMRPAYFGLPTFKNMPVNVPGTTGFLHSVLAEAAKQ